VQIAVVGIIIAAVVGIFAIGTFFLNLARRVGDVRDARLQTSQQEFRNVRQFLNEKRHSLTEQAYGYYGENPEFVRTLQCEVGQKFLTTNVLARSTWIPEDPLPLGSVHLRRLPGTQKNYSAVVRKAKAFWPYESTSARYPNYHEATASLDRPRLWENRDSFAIAKVDVTGSDYELSFRTGKYFDHLDTGEALAYELAATQWQAIRGGKGSYLTSKELQKKLKCRRAIGSPPDFSRRCGVVGINTLTIFDADSAPRFIMHHRKGGNVALAGDMHGVVPAGEFQPAIVQEGIITDALEWDEIVRRDFDLWLNIMREGNEEILGAPEITYTEPYVDVEPFKSLNAARTSGKLKTYFLGFVLDPLSLKPDVLTACVFKGKSFSDIFSKVLQPGATRVNAEGDLDFGRDNAGIRFDEHHVEEYVSTRNTFPAGKACLVLLAR